jgi:hypothetical protein
MKPIKIYKSIFIALLFIVISAELRAQITPCGPTQCNPPCVKVQYFNHVPCDIDWQFSYNGCSDYYYERAYQQTPPPPVIPNLVHNIPCGKCPDGPCACPIKWELFTSAGVLLTFSWSSLTGSFPTGVYYVLHPCCPDVRLQVSVMIVGGVYQVSLDCVP